MRMGSEEVGCEGEGLMEVDGEVHSTKKFDQRQREIIKQLRNAGDFADLSLEFFAAHKRHGGWNCRTLSEDRMIYYPITRASEDAKDVVAK